MWGQFNNLTKLVSEQAGSVIKEAGLDATLNTAKQQLTGQLDKLASSVLVIEPGQPAKGVGANAGFREEAATNLTNGQESASLKQLWEENAKLQLQVRKLQETAADVLGELEEAQDALAREQAARTTAEQRLEAVQRELQSQFQNNAVEKLGCSLKEEVEALKEALAASEANAKSFETKGRRQYNQLMATRQQLTELEATHTRLQQQHAALEKQYQDLQEELEMHRSRGQEFQASCRGDDNDAGGKMPDLDELSSQLEGLRLQLKLRDERLEQLQAERVEQEHQHAAAMEAASAARTEVEAQAQARAAALEAAAEDLRVQLDSARAGLEEAEARVQHLRGESARLTAELESKSLQMQELAEASGAASAALSTELSSVRQQVEALSAEASQLRSERIQQQQGLQECGTLLELERRRATDAETGRRDADSRASAAGAELERFKQRLASEEARHRREMDELNDSLDELRRQANEQGRAAAASTSMAHRIAMCVSQLESAAALYEAARKPCASYDNLFDELQERLAELQGRRNIAGTAAAPVSAPLHEALDQELSRLRVELVQLRPVSEAAAQLRKQLAARDKELYDARQRTILTEQERDSLGERLQRLQGQLREAREAREACGAETEEQRRLLQADLEATEQRARELEGRLAAATAVAEAAKQDASAASQRIVDLKAQIAAEAGKAAEATASTFKALTERAEAAEAQVRQLRDQLDAAVKSSAAASAEAEGRLRQLEDVNARLQAELDRTSTELLKAQACVEAFECERSRLHEELTRGSVALEEAQARAAAQLEGRRDLEDACKGLESRLVALEAEAAELRRQSDQDSEVSKATASALAAAQSNVAQLKACVLELEQQLAKGDQALQASERAVAQVKSELSDTKSELAALRSQLGAAETKADRLSREIADKAAALEAVRTGSQAEVALTVQRLSAATTRVSELEAALATATSQHDQAASALQHKLTAMEKEAVSARATVRQLEQQVSVLRDSLTAERDAAAATTAVVRSELESRMAAEVATATAALTKQWQARLDEAAVRHATALQETQQELDTVRQRAQVAEEELAVLQAASGDMERLRKKVADFGPLTARLEADKAAACRAAADAHAAQQQLEDRVRAMEAEAAERNRKFQMLQRSFKGEVELARQQLEAVQAQIASHVAAAAAAEQHAEEATARCQAAEAKRAALQQQLEDAHAATARLEASLAAQIATAAEGAGKLAVAEAMLAEERAGQMAAHNNGESLRQDFERMVAAAVAAREEEAERRVAAAVAREQSALAEARQAEARAEAAELAKIELTLALARVDDEGRPAATTGPRGLRPSVSSLGHVANLVGTSPGDYNAGGASHSGDADGEGAGAADFLPSPASLSHDRRLAARQGQFLAEMQQRVDEAELAAAVQTRRAVGLEAEVAKLQQQLSESQRQVKELSWQISVAVGDTPVTSGGRGPRGGAGGTAGAGGAASRMGMFDILGCGANYRRN